MDRARPERAIVGKAMARPLVPAFNHAGPGLPGGNAALEIAEDQFMVFRGDCPGVAGKGSSGSPLGTAQLLKMPSLSAGKDYCALSNSKNAATFRKSAHNSPSRQEGFADVRQADHDHAYMVPDMVPEPDLRFSVSLERLTYMIPPGRRDLPAGKNFPRPLTRMYTSVYLHLSAIMWDGCHEYRSGPR
jgi:hypothetical protein